MKKALPNKDGILEPLLEAIKEKNFANKRVCTAYFCEQYDAPAHDVAVLVDWAIMPLKVAKFMDHHEGKLRITKDGEKFLHEHKGNITVEKLFSVPAFVGYFTKL